MLAAFGALPPPLPGRALRRPLQFHCCKQLGTVALLLGAAPLALHGSDLGLGPIPVLWHSIPRLLYGPSVGVGLAKPVLEVPLSGGGQRPHLLPPAASLRLHLLLLLFRPLGNLLNGRHGRCIHSSSGRRGCASAGGLGRGAPSVRGGGLPLGRRS